LLCVARVSWLLKRCYAIDMILPNTACKLGITGPPDMSLFEVRLIAALLVAAVPLDEALPCHDDDVILITAWQGIG
jgi:hypothetical protein